MRLLFVVIQIGMLFLITACAEQNKIEQLSGFWVSIDYKNEKAFHTFIIKDSLLQVDKYGTSWIYNPTYALWPAKDHVEAHYTFDGWYTAFVLFVNNDTLTQVYGYSEPNERKIKYVRMDSLSIDRKLLYNDSPLKIDLPDAGEKNEWVSIERKSLISSLYIGRVKKGNTSEFPGVSTDSFVIQVDDILIPFDGIQTFLKNEQAKLDESDRENFITLLHADKETPEDFIIKIREAVTKYNPKLRVCRAYVKWGARQILFEEI